MDLSNRSYPYGGVGIFQNFFGIEFSISHTTNTGAAWGAFQSIPWILVAFRIALIACLVAYFVWGTCFSWGRLSNKERVPLLLIIVGAFSNVVDTFTYGHVVDMLHFVLWGWDFPVFNIADSAIFIGGLWMCLLSFFNESTELSLQSKSLKR